MVVLGDVFLFGWVPEVHVKGLRPLVGTVVCLCKNGLKKIDYFKVDALSDSLLALLENLCVALNLSVLQTLMATLFLL